MLIAVLAAGAWVYYGGFQYSAPNSYEYSYSGGSSSNNSNSSTPTSSTSIGQWYIRLYNSDDKSQAEVNDSLVATANYREETDWIDITDYLNLESNRVHFSVWNSDGGYTWGFSVSYNGTIVWDDHEGTVGSLGANNDDRSKPNQLIYERTLMLNSNGTVSDISASTDSGQNNEQQDVYVATDIQIGSTVEVISVESNIRSQPNPDDNNNILGQIKRGARLEVVDGPVWIDTTSDDGRPIKRSWWQVRGWDSSGNVGWCSSRYLQVIP